MTEKPQAHKNQPIKEISPEPQPVHETPAPVQEAPAQPQPVMQQQPQPQQVQYVVMEKSNKGIGGWLIFWLVMFGLAAIGYITTFFASMLNLDEATGVVSLIFSPLLAVGYIMSIVMIAMEKKIGKLITWITLGVSGLYSIVNMIVAYATASQAVSSYSRYRSYSYREYDSDVQQALPLLIGMILVTIVIHALVALYFILSKRVKETLVK